MTSSEMLIHLTFVSFFSLLLLSSPLLLLLLLPNHGILGYNTHTLSFWAVMVVVGMMNIMYMCLFVCLFNGWLGLSCVG